MDRTVGNLTTEQLYRKRAFDRVNQRVSRARKKTRIAELEDEVAELKRLLAHSEEQNKRLQNSEATLRDTISAARSTLQIIDAANPDQASIPSPPASTHTGGSARDDISVAGDDSLSISTNGLSAQRLALVSAGTGTFTTCTPDLSLEGEISAFELRDEVTGLTLGVPLTHDFDSMFHYEGFGKCSNVSFINPTNTQEVTDPNNSSPLSFSFLSQFPQDAENITWSPLPLEMPVPNLQQPKWERLPINVSPTCRLDTVLLEQSSSTRQHLQTSGPIPELSAQAFPSISSLLNPESSSLQTPISSAIGIHGRVTMEIPSLPEKIAMMYNMCIYLRWLISPTKLNYEALPETLRPIEIQLTTPHPIWIDLVVWPEARERFIKFMDWSQFPHFREVGNRTFNINWVHGQSKLFSILPEKGLGLDPIFENHIRKAENWTIGSEMFSEFPFLKNMAQIRVVQETSV